MNPDLIAALITEDPDIINEQLLVENFITAAIQHTLLYAKTNLSKLAQKFGIQSKQGLIKQIERNIAAYDQRQRNRKIDPIQLKRAEQLASSTFNMILNASSKITKTVAKTTKNVVNPLADPEMVMAIVTFSCIMGIATSPLTGAPMIGALVASIVSLLLTKLRDFVIGD